MIERNNSDWSVDQSLVEPSADHRAVAKTLHQMYVALRAEGFTDEQAIALVGVTLNATISK